MAFTLLQLDPVRICHRKSEIVKGTRAPSKAQRRVPISQGGKVRLERVSHQMERQDS
jgi:hypothetical protein